MLVVTFRNDEKGYLDWVARHPHGFVVNTRREFDPEYLVLHSASCPTIKQYPKMEEEPGGFTEKGYQKICSVSKDALEVYLSSLIDRESPFSKVCSICSG